MLMEVKLPVNFRDLGGLTGDNGRKIKNERILRSGEILGLKQEDKDILLNYYNLRTIIDFRSEEEVIEKADDKLEGVKYLNIDVLKDARERKYQLTSAQKDLMKMSESGNVDDVMKNIYISLISDKSAITGYRQFIDELLILEEGSLIFHCFAGKDRTGIAAAILLSFLGVSEDAVFTDYMLTNELRAETNERMIEEFREQGKSEEFLRGAKVALYVEEKYLRYAYEIAKEESGTFCDYFIKMLNVSKSELAGLKRLYLS